MFLAALGSTGGWDVVVWLAKTGTWVWGDFSWYKALGAARYGSRRPMLSLLTTCLVFTALTCLGAVAMKLNVKRFFAGWTLLFIITWTVWIIGHEAHFKASINEFDKYGLSWGLS